jgi:hypothetical protein
MVKSNSLSLFSISFPIPENTHRDMVNRIREVNHRSAVLQARSDKSADEVGEYEVLNNRICSRIHQYKSLDK